MARSLLVLVMGGALALGGCGLQEPVPAFGGEDARFGRLGGSGEIPSRRTMCEQWLTSVAGRDEWALSHVSFPETDVQSACFTKVTHDGRSVTAAAPPRGCAYPSPQVRVRLEALATELEAIADSASHVLFPCSLTDGERIAAARQNARTLRAIARRPETFPYSAVVVPGHGILTQNDTALLGTAPGDACRKLRDGDEGRLGMLPFRSSRAADAMRGGVAPAVIVSGGAVHSRVVEAFAMMQLLECGEHIEPDRIIVEPCADHTHTNLRNSGRWIHAMGGRAGYLLTDDFLQSDYFQDSSGFEMLLGSIDQRSLRDWGYLLGSWRQASIGIKSGFWFTPYRFWAEARDGLGSATCVIGP